MSVPALPDALWEEYSATRAPRIQEQIVIHYTPLVNFVARQVAQGLPAHVDRDDLVSWGNMGLLDAIEKFDLGRAVKFQTYAMTRIRGSIIDGLRAVDWVPRSVRSAAREVHRTTVALESELGRLPTQREVAAATGQSTQQLSRLSQEVLGANFLPLDAQVPIGGKGDLVSEAETVEDIRVETPESAAVLAEVRMLIAQGVPNLAEHLRMVVTLHHFYGLGFGEIAVALKVTESRVCQLSSQAMLALSRMPL